VLNIFFKTITQSYAEETQSCTEREIGEGRKEKGEGKNG